MQAGRGWWLQQHSTLPQTTAAYKTNFQILPHWFCHNRKMGRSERVCMFLFGNVLTAFALPGWRICKGRNLWKGFCEKLLYLPHTRAFLLLFCTKKNRTLLKISKSTMVNNEALEFNFGPLSVFKTNEIDYQTHGLVHQNGDPCTNDAPSNRESKQPG